ncbi:MAG: hypothetical protein HRT67_01875 [Flavobacteriaceae bacterium]|nr:hypothetical protein [Flavobacteriaceae bacterium]
MKTIVFTICILLSTFPMTAQDNISGVWDLGEGNTKLEIKGSEGKVISSDNLEAGTLLLKDIISNNDKWNAKLYSPKKKKWFDATLKDSGNLLLVTIKAGFMSKTLEWMKE